MQPSIDKVFSVLKETKAGPIKKSLLLLNSFNIPKLVSVSLAQAGIFDFKNNSN
jgi:hypothetical protein